MIFNGKEQIVRANDLHFHFLPIQNTLPWSMVP